MNVPEIAIVGFVNAGKSSLVAALSEHGDIEIDELGGTTRTCHRYTCPRGGNPLLVLIDTPGFQDARHANVWMAEWQGARAGSTGPESVRAYLHAHAGERAAVNEVRVLQAVMDCGAGLIYVAHADQRCKRSHEAELALLARTGRPRMGVLNLAGNAQYADKWRGTLAVHCGKVHEIDAVYATFAQRMQLLNSFKGLDDDWAPSITRAVQLLQRDRERIHDTAADAIATCLCDCLTARVYVPFSEAESGSRDRAEASAGKRLRHRLADTEAAARRTVQDALGHERVAYRADEQALVDADIDSAEVWRRFGMGRLKLVATGVGAGAATGAAVDLAVGEISFGAGMAIGSVLGAVAGLAATRDVEVTVPGLRLGLGNPTKVEARPPRRGDFPIVLLNRAFVHFEAFAGLSHANRTDVAGPGQEAGASRFAALPGPVQKDLLRALAPIVKAARKGRQPTDVDRGCLAGELRRILDTLDPISER